MFDTLESTYEGRLFPGRIDPSAFRPTVCLALPLRRAPPRRASPVICSSSLDSIDRLDEDDNSVIVVVSAFLCKACPKIHIAFPDIPYMISAYSDNKRRFTGSGPGKKSASRLAGKLQVKRGFRFSSAYIGFRYFVLLKGRSGQECTMPSRIRASVVLWANRAVGGSSCPAQHPAAPCAAPTRPARGTPNPPTKSSLFRALESRSLKRSARKCIV